MLGATLLVLFSAFISTAAGTCGHALKCKDPVAPATADIVYCPDVMPSTQEIDFDSISLSFTPPVDYSGVKVFGAVYYEDVPTPLVAKASSFSCKDLPKQLRPFIACPGKAGKKISHSFTDLKERLSFYLNAGNYTLHLEVSNEHGALMTCFNLPLTLRDGPAPPPARDADAGQVPYPGSQKHRVLADGPGHRIYDNRL